MQLEGSQIDAIFLLLPSFPADLSIDAASLSKEQLWTSMIWDVLCGERAKQKSAVLLPSSCFYLALVTTLCTSALVTNKTDETVQ